MTPVTKELLRAVSKPSTKEELASIDDYEMVEIGRKSGSGSNVDIVYHIVKEPEFGKIQYRFEGFSEDLTGPGLYTNKFTQNDIDQGR
jgi:hypothetical protein